MSQPIQMIRPRSKTIAVPHREIQKINMEELLNKRYSSPIEFTPQNTPNTPYFKGLSQSSKNIIGVSLPPSAKVKNSRSIHFLNLM